MFLKFKLFLFCYRIPYSEMSCYAILHRLVLLQPVHVLIHKDDLVSVLS